MPIVDGYAIGPSADLVDATLMDTDLTGVNLSRARLTGANLAGTNFTGANLTDVNFAGADLSYVNFTNANLACANLRGAILKEACFYGANLAHVKGILRVGPSIDGYDFFAVRRDGVVWIKAGCRWFTVTDARAHWAFGERRDTEIGNQRLHFVDFLHKNCP